MEHDSRVLRGAVTRICCLVLTLSMVTGCDDPNRGPPTRYSYFDAVVEFTAEGKRLKAETTVQCMTPGGLTPGHRPLGPTSSHSFVTKRLPSGAGVMFHIPRGCYGAPGRKLPPPNAIPLAYWLDDAANPTVIEKYISLMTIGPGNRIEAIHYAYVGEKYGYGETPRPYSDPTIEIPWLESQKEKNRTASKVAWVGYLATYAPRELWRQHKSLTALTEKFKGQRDIVRLGVHEIPEDVRGLLDHRAINEGLILPQQGSSNNASDSPYQIGLRTRTILLKPEGEWTPNSTYRVSLKANWPSGKVELKPVPRPSPGVNLAQLIVDGTTIRGPFRASTVFYDVKTGSLFHVSYHGF